MSRESRALPRWVTSWPEWFGLGPIADVTVVPAEDYDKLLAAINTSLPSGMAELVLESAGLTSSGSAAQAGDKSGTAPTASVLAVKEVIQRLRAMLTNKRVKIGWYEETAITDAIKLLDASRSENADISLQAKLDKAQQYAGAVCIACSRLGIDFGNLTHEIHAVMREAIANSSVERKG